MFFEPRPAGEETVTRQAGLFEFAVEWPFGGIAETIVELGGAAIAAAAARPGYYWPPS